MGKMNSIYYLYYLSSVFQSRCYRCRVPFNAPRVPSFGALLPANTTSCRSSIWVEATRRRFKVYRAKKEQYWTYRLMQCGSSSPRVWRSLSSMFGRQRDVTGSTSHSADGFATFFEKKIDDIRSDTAALPPPPVISQASSSLTSFRQLTEAEVRRIVMTSPTKSYSLDPVPTFLLPESIDLLLPYVT